MEHVLYSELRPLCVTWALSARESTFLSKSEWKVIPWMGGGQKNVLHHLLVLFGRGAANIKLL
jgi:hypothetical protein